MSAPTDAEVDRVARRLAILERRWRTEHESEFRTIVAVAGIQWSRVGDDFVATVADRPVIVVPVAVVLDPDLNGVVLDQPGDFVPETWTQGD